MHRQVGKHLVGLTLNSDEIGLFDEFDHSLGDSARLVGSPFVLRHGGEHHQVSTSVKHRISPLFSHIGFECFACIFRMPRHHLDLCQRETCHAFNRVTALVFGSACSRRSEAPCLLEVLRNAKIVGIVRVEQGQSGVVPHASPVGAESTCNRVCLANSTESFQCVESIRVDLCFETV